MLDSLEDEVWSRVNSLADTVVSREGDELGPTAGPHGPAVLWMCRLAQTHDRSVDVSYVDSFNRLPILLLEGEKQDEDRTTAIKHRKKKDTQRKHWIFYLMLSIYLEYRVLINSKNTICCSNQQIVLSLAEKNHEGPCYTSIKNSRFRKMVKIMVKTLQASTLHQLTSNGRKRP